MALASSLLVKLLIAAAAITPAAGYGGYCLYEYCVSPSGNYMTRQGFIFSTISADWNENELNSQQLSGIAGNLGGDWRCAKQVFGNIDIPSIEAQAKDETNETITPQAYSGSTGTSESNSIGCLVADLGLGKDVNNKVELLRWELALKKGDKGFIYLGSFLTERKGNDSSTQRVSNMIFEIIKGGDKWNIKDGVYWEDKLEISDETSGNTTVSVTLPNEKSSKDESQNCSSESKNKYVNKDEWTLKKYIGFWEEANGGQQLVNSMKLEVKGGENTKKHDFWSNEEFNFETTKTTNDDDNPPWNGSVANVYKSNKWFRMSSQISAKDFLKSIYSPWANKKGTWINAVGVCDNLEGENLKENDEATKKLLKFCYHK